MAKAEKHLTDYMDSKRYAPRRNWQVKSKYEPLEIYLQGRPKPDKELSLSFKEVEEIIGGSLPTSAYKYREKWCQSTFIPNISRKCAPTLFSAQIVRSARN